MPTSEYDFDTLVSVVTSLGSTVLVCLLAVFACMPEAKFTQDVTKQLKKHFPSLVGADAAAVPHSTNTSSNHRRRKQEDDEDEDE